MSPPPSAFESLLKQRVWAGRIPVVFRLDPNEVTTLHAPRPFYAMVPRMSYLVSQTRDVVEYFRDAAPPMSTLQGASIWFKANGVPLHWHLPFGLLRDLLCGPGAADLPWALTVHFLGFPSDVLLPCDNEQSVESHFMHSLKQATFLRTGSTKAVMGLPEAQQTRIWTSILQSKEELFSCQLRRHHGAEQDVVLCVCVADDYESYREATHDLHLDGGENVSALRHLPLRVHLNNAPAIQMRITPLENGREKLLLEVLRFVLPDLFPETSFDSQEFQLVVHGVFVPSNVSIVELYRNFSYADGFLYVAVLSKS